MASLVTFKPAKKLTLRVTMSMRARNRPRKARTVRRVIFTMDLIELTTR